MLQSAKRAQLNDRLAKIVTLSSTGVVNSAPGFRAPHPSPTKERKNGRRCHPVLSDSDTED